MNMRAWTTVLAIAAVACGHKDSDRAADHAQTTTTRPVVKIDGPSIAPIITDSITFVASKEGSWGEMSFACLNAVLSLDPSGSPTATFMKSNPTAVTAMTAAGIDLDHDIAAIGGFECAGSFCMYIAGNLRHPEKVKSILEATLPGTPLTDLGHGHYTVVNDAGNGPRTVDFRVVPIQWPATLPADTWSTQAATATHVVFITSAPGANASSDPLASLATGAAAAARVADSERLLADRHGRCALGSVGANDFKPGFKLTGARFALAAPEGKSDPITELLGSHRTVDLEVDFALAPIPTDAVVQGWIADAHAWVHDMYSSVAAGLAAEMPLIDAMADLGRVLADRGFSYKISPTGLSLSWRTDRVPRAAIEDIAAKVGAFAGGATP